jgi:biotin-(acetyl-CoA carboxylase) ligase
MPLQTRLRTPFADVLDLPPPFTAVSLREAGNAFEHAVRIAPESGAGTLVHVGRFDLAEFAVVLEPDEPLRTARRAFYAGMVALHDALLVHAPPEKPITIDWPGSVRVDGGLVGGARFAWPKGAGENEPAPWVVFGAMIRTVAMSDQEPGLRPLGAALEEEGFDDLGAGRLAESFARHLMVIVDAWQERGFGAVAREYLPHLAPEPGARRDIDENGDLLVRPMAGTDAERRGLVAALDVPAWLDPATGGPRL